MIRDSEETITVHLRFNLSKSDFNALVKLCDECNINASELVSNLIARWLDERQETRCSYDVFDL